VLLNVGAIFVQDTLRRKPEQKKCEMQREKCKMGNNASSFAARSLYLTLMVVFFCFLRNRKVMFVPDQKNFRLVKHCGQEVLLGRNFGLELRERINCGVHFAQLSSFLAVKKIHSK
jgi:hypothetical protein